MSATLPAALATCVAAPPVCPRCQHAGAMTPYYTQYPDDLWVCPRCTFRGFPAYFVPIPLTPAQDALYAQLLTFAGQTLGPGTNSYPSDLYVHDRHALAGRWGALTVFAWGIYDLGTHLLAPATCPKGNEIARAFDACHGHFPGIRWHWCAGNTIRPCTPEQARTRLVTAAIAQQEKGRTLR